MKWRFTRRSSTSDSHTSNNSSHSSSSHGSESENLSSPASSVHEHDHGVTVICGRAISEDGEVYDDDLKAPIVGEKVLTKDQARHLMHTLKESCDSIMSASIPEVNLPENERNNLPDARRILAQKAIAEAAKLSTTWATAHLLTNPDPKKAKRKKAPVTVIDGKALDLLTVEEGIVKARATPVYLTPELLNLLRSEFERHYAVQDPQWKHYFTDLVVNLGTLCKLQMIRDAKALQV